MNKDKKRNQESGIRNQKFWLIPVLALGALMRLYHSTSIALWHDEAFSALYIRYPWGEMMHRIGLDVHPPLYYWMLRIWTGIFGQGLFGLRSLSILLGVLSIYAGYLFVKEIFKNEKLALLAAFFLAINPFLIQYGWEARMYSLGTFLILLSSYLLVKALNTDKTWIWAAYAVSIAASFYTHYFLFFSVAAQGLFFIYYCFKQKQWFPKGWASYALSAVLFAPWVPTLIEQVTRVNQNFWIAGPNGWSVLSTLWTMFFGGYGTDHTTLAIFAPLALILIIYFLRQTALPMRWLIFSSVAVPVVGALLLSFMQSIYLDRYFYFASLFYAIMLAVAIYQVPKYTTRRAMATIFAVISIAVFFKNWADLDVRHKPGMAAAAAYINENARPTDRIYVGLSAVYFTLKYYNETPIHPKLYSKEAFKDISHYSGTALLNEEDIILNFSEAQKNDTVWLVWTTGFFGSKPNVPGNWQKIAENEYPDTPWFKGNIIVTSYHVD